jgi:AmmeMemoRadiSam system protein A
LKLSLEFFRFKEEPAHFSIMLTSEEQRALLEIARASIADALVAKGQRSVQGGSPGGVTLSGGLAKPSGAFVTIRVGRDLRGCIGYIESDLPLVEVIREVAVKAATEDPRFPPMTQSELARASLEISVLSPLTVMEKLEQLEVGKHGILLVLGRARGLLLPQVAVEYGWGREEFLDHTARKAGLPPKSWRDPQAKIFLFRAEIFEEQGG